MILKCVAFVTRTNYHHDSDNLILKSDCYVCNNLRLLLFHEVLHVIKVIDSNIKNVNERSIMRDINSVR